MAKRTHVHIERHQPSPYRCVECRGQVTVVNDAEFALHDQSGEVIGSIRAECVVYCLEPRCQHIRIRLRTKAVRHGVSATSDRVHIVTRGERLYEATTPANTMNWSADAVLRIAEAPPSAANNP